MSRDQIDPRDPNSTGRPEEYIFDPSGLIDPAPGCTKELEAETGERTLWGMDGHHHEQWKKTTWLLRVYWGLYCPVVLGLSYTSRRMKDPYQTASIMESKFAFFLMAHISSPQ